MKQALIDISRRIPLLSKLFDRIYELKKEVEDLTQKNKYLNREVEEFKKEINHWFHVHQVINQRYFGNLPLPSEELRLHVGTRTTAANFLSQGANSSGRVLDIFGSDPTEPILDWGCGSGRTWRWLQVFPAWQQHYFGCDVDGEAIQWLKDCGPQNVSICYDEPPLPYPDDHFGGVFSFSVLTHIHPSKHRIWYEEIRRVLKPGGKALLTTQGHEIVATFPKLPSDIKQAYLQQGYAYHLSPGHYMDAALVSEEYTRKMLEGIFEIIDYKTTGYQNLDIFLVK